MKNKTISRLMSKVLFFCLCINTLPLSVPLHGQASRRKISSQEVERDIALIKKTSAGLKKVKKAAPFVVAGAGIAVIILATIMAVILYSVLRKLFKKAVDKAKQLVDESREQVNETMIAINETKVAFKKQPIMKELKQELDGYLFSLEEAKKNRKWLKKYIFQMKKVGERLKRKAELADWKLSEMAKTKTYNDIVREMGGKSFFKSALDDKVKFFKKVLKKFKKGTITPPLNKDPIFLEKKSKFFDFYQKLVVELRHATGMNNRAEIRGLTKGIKDFQPKLIEMVANTLNVSNDLAMLLVRYDSNMLLGWADPQKLQSDLINAASFKSRFNSWLKKIPNRIKTILENSKKTVKNYPKMLEVGNLIKEKMIYAEHEEQLKDGISELEEVRDYFQEVKKTAKKILGKIKLKEKKIRYKTLKLNSQLVGNKNLLNRRNIDFKIYSLKFKILNIGTIVVSITSFLLGLSGTVIASLITHFETSGFRFSKKTLLAAIDAAKKLEQLEEKNPETLNASQKRILDQFLVLLGDATVQGFVKNVRVSALLARVVDNTLKQEKNLVAALGGKKEARKTFEKYIKLKWKENILLEGLKKANNKLKRFDVKLRLNRIKKKIKKLESKSEQLSKALAGAVQAYAKQIKVLMQDLVQQVIDSAAQKKLKPHKLPQPTIAL